MEEEFKFLINQSVDRDYHGDEIVEIAKIVEMNSSTDVLYVFYDRDSYAKRHFHISAGLYDKNEVPAVMIDDEHKDCLYDQSDVFFCLMLHELGHYRNKDFEKLADENTTSNLNKRTENIIKGKVQDAELNADSFAVKHIGKNKMIRTMDYMIKKRKERKNDPGKEIAIREIELRKKAIQKLKI